jgi:hypothetical protein
VYLVWNTLFNLTSQARQVDCFRNVARVLEPGGVFVIECFVPDPARFDRGVPSELDLMAQLAGLRLRERFGDWTRTPFTSASRGHVSVYEPA